MSALRVGTWTFWMLVVAASFYFYLDNAIAYFFGYRSPRFGNTWLANQLWFTLHIVAASLPLWLGPIQFSATVRGRYPRYHRVAGRMYVGGVLVAGLMSIKLSTLSDCAGCRVPLVTLSVVWLLVTGAAFAAILARNFAVHRHFMMLSYTCTLAFVTIRLVYELPGAWFGFIENNEVLRTNFEWLCWVVPLLFVEVFVIGIPVIKRRRTDQPAAGGRPLD